MAQGSKTPSLPSESEARLARETRKILNSLKRSAKPLRLCTVDNPTGKTLSIPACAVQMLLKILDEMSKGNTVTLVPIHAELTTQEAADLLNISRPSLIQLLDKGKIPFRKIGTHRRIPFETLVQYKRRASADRLAALAELAAYDRELGI